jgi:hypothetical protein
MAAQALREGHLPCLVASKKKEWQPRNTGQLAERILRAILTARKAFGLEKPTLDKCATLYQLTRKAPYDGLDRDQASLFPSMVFEDILGHYTDTALELDGPTLRNALQIDLLALLNEARDKHDTVGPNSRVVLLLNRVHQYGNALDPLLTDLIKGYGLGEEYEPIPVALCYAKGDESADETWREVVERGSKNWLLKELTGFRTDNNEHMLAYEQVLLHPDQDDPKDQELKRILEERLHSPWTDIPTPVVPLAFKHAAGGDDLKHWSDLFEMAIKGIPELMRSNEMHMMIYFACWQQFVVEADDEMRLQRLRP